MTVKPVRIGIYCPPDLADQARRAENEAAARELRRASLNAWIVQAIREKLAREGENEEN